jgi:hypothetical protein
VLTVGGELARALDPVALQFLAIVAHASHKVPVSAGCTLADPTRSPPRNTRSDPSQRPR